MKRYSSWRTTTIASNVRRPIADVWEVAASGSAGPQWYVDSLPWLVRGGIDRLTGGEGRRWPPPGRDLLQPGDTAGFWRVTECDTDRHRLVLVADVRAPGTVTLTTTIRPAGPRRCLVEQAVRLDPAGILGVAYLLADLPARQVVMELAHRRLLRDLNSI